MWKVLVISVFLVAAAFAASTTPASRPTTVGEKSTTLSAKKTQNSKLNNLKNRVGKLEKALKVLTQAQEKAEKTKVEPTSIVTNEQLKEVVKALARQVNLQQQYAAEVHKSSGDSGLKTTRLTDRGTRPYHSTSFAGRSVAQMHNHNNYKYTLGMGDMVAVLNGVEFRTRHNDYKMNMPSRTSTEYGKVEPVPFPDVPPEVLSKPTVEEQIKEMQLWFKAWQDQDSSTRDYTKYFKPILCYLEGMWTYSNGNKIDEPFASDRHSIDASSFFDLQDKLKYTAYTGRKSTGENFAFLPTTIAHLDDQGFPIYAQWNYKILCHPLKDDLPLKRLRVEDDVATRLGKTETIDQWEKSRYARFSLWPSMNTKTRFDSERFQDGRIRSTSYLDSLMLQIPGKDNYKANVIDDVFDEVAYKPSAKPPPMVNGSRDWSQAPDPMNVGFYHTVHKVMSKDAMGLSTRLRGFNDANLYVAYNTQPKVMSAEVNSCKKQKGKKVCKSWKHSVSYAVPLEMVWLTPLTMWNPYKLKHMSYNDMKKGSPSGELRNGGQTNETAFNGVNQKSWYYLTPVDFFGSATDGRDPADTTKSGVGVLDPQGKVQLVKASGTPLFLPSIPGVGIVRLRYPVMPLHANGDLSYKTASALLDMTLQHQKYSKYYPSGHALDNTTVDENFLFEMALTTKNPPGEHTHTFELTMNELMSMKNGTTLEVITTNDQGHDHELQLRYSPNKSGQVFMFRCDGKKFSCWDGHTRYTACVNCYKPLKELIP